MADKRNQNTRPSLNTTSKARQSLHILPVLALLILILLGCQPAEPLPTPTPTRTPVLPTATPTHTPTPTPTHTPTPTPTPTPTLPPGLILPPTPTTPDSWPTLPADLYFLREGRLWVWLAEGGQLQALPVAEDAEDSDILEYRITGDKRFIVYATNAGKLYVFDRALWQHTHIPIAGHLIEETDLYFEITPDEQTLIYAAWGVKPNAGKHSPGIAAPAPSVKTAEGAYATLLSLDLQNPRQVQQTLGACTGLEGIPCAGFLLSPDGSQIVYTDGYGIWHVHLAEPEPKLLLPYETVATWFPQTMSADNQWIVLKSKQIENPIFAFLNTDTGEVSVLESSVCSSNCRVEASWGTYEMWLSWNNEREGCLQRIELDTYPSPPEITYQLCRADLWALHPTSPHALPDGWVAFVHNGCGDDCPGPAPGLYFLSPDDLVRPIALLPQSGGSALWIEDGSAFLYFDTNGYPRYLGVTNGAGFWDVHTKLEGAHTFQWDQPVVLLTP